MLLFSFLVASLCEEATKYYGVVMTRLPSPFPDSEIYKISKRRRASACTTYFICVALGFSTAENLLLTVTRNAQDSAKLVTLCMRFVMPIHVLTSAIMSVFVVQEEIDKADFVGLHNGVNGSEGTTVWNHLKSTCGKIKPIFLLHGPFDFVLFGLGYFIDGRKPHSDVELVDSNEDARLSPFDNMSIVGENGMHTRETKQRIVVAAFRFSQHFSLHSLRSLQSGSAVGSSSCAWDCFITSASRASRIGG